MRKLTLAMLLGTTLGAPAALADTADGSALIGQDWDAIVEMARGGEVNWFMWGGADNINGYVNDYIGGILRDEYGITLNQIPLSDTVEAVNIVLGEREAGNTDAGSVDMIWINGENFRTMRQGDLVWCGKGDHLDIVGHFTGEGRNDWLASGAAFTQTRFDVVVDQIVAGMMVSEHRSVTPQGKAA